MAQAEEIVKNLVPEIAKEHNFVNYDSKVVPISSGGANYASVLYNITLSEGDRVIHMFAKVAVMGEQMRSQTPMDMYEREIFVYTNLLKVYERLQDEHQVPEEHRLSFSKFYFCHRTKYEETVVLENLVMSGYQSFDRFTTVDWEYAKTAIGDLAKMHALSFAYSEYYTEKFNKVITERPSVFDAFRLMKDYFKKPYMQATEVVKEDNKDKLRRYADNFVIDMFVDYYTVARRPVLGHGDFRPSNLMHRIRDDGTIDIKIVDLQTVQSTNPVTDLLYFIFTGTDEQFRAQYFDKLIDHYYTQLASAMTRLHLDPDKIYSREDFDFEFKEKLPFGLTMAVFILPLLTVAAEDAPEVNEDMDMSSIQVEKINDLYIERVNGVVNDYVKWGVLT